MRLPDEAREEVMMPDVATQSVNRPRPALSSTPAVDVNDMSLTELVDHIESTHHARLRDELPRLAMMLRKIVLMHGESDPRLFKVQITFRTMASELSCHMLKGEECLFPLIRRLEESGRPPEYHRGTLANLIRQMTLEHDDTDSALERLHELTDGFVPPEWACKTYRALLSALDRLDEDVRSHIHEEVHVLFPTTLEMEATSQRRLPTK